MIISDHISLAEYSCRCPCHQLPPALRGGDIPTCYEWFFEDFEDIRREYGKPIPIGSGYRCPAHNQAIGGELISAHLWGLALDLDLPNVKEVEDLQLIVEAIHPELRMGIYKDTATFIHIDCIYSVFPPASVDWQKGVRWHK
jgi:hypothetical protein